jgi:ABC-2 type transport system permease protein
VRLIMLLLAKELRDIHRNRGVASLYIAMPLLMVVFTVGLTWAVPRILEFARTQQDPGMLATIRVARAIPEFAGLPEPLAVTRYFLRLLVGFYLLGPTIGAGTAAAFSIVGEKTQRTLEPILATPITDRQLLLGKMLGAVVPPIIASWGVALVATIGVDVIGWQRFGETLLPDRFWLVGVLVLGPLLGAAATLLTMRLSARMTDAQAANQATALIVMPVFLLVLGVFGRVMIASFTAALASCGVALAVAVYLLQVNLARFRREEILTRWK